jgi:hypothetical protein
MSCDSCPNIRKANSSTDAIRAFCIRHENRDLFACVISAAPGGIAAVIRGNDQEIIASQPFEQLRQSCVERFESCGISGNVPAMTVDRIEIDEVGKQQSALRQAVQSIKGGIEEGVIAIAARIPSGPPVREDVVDLADGHDITTVTLGNVQERAFRGRNGEIPAVRGPLESGPGSADEWSRNDAPYIKGIDQSARGLTDIVKAFEPKDVLMRCDLEHTIGGSVADRLAALHVALAKFGDDLRPRCMAVSENPGQTGLGAQALYEIVGKAGYAFRKISPIEGDRYASDFPMP